MSAYWIDLRREIRFTLGRFLSLLIITALGAATVIGIQAAAIQMREIADATFKAHSLYDLEVVSRTGLTADDLAAIRGAPGVAEVMGTNFADLFIDVNDETVAARVWAMPDGLNTLDLLAGRLPEAPGECAVEQDLLNDLADSIGDDLPLNTAPGPEFSLVTLTECEIVGVVNSPLYISGARGQTSLGNGSLQYYLYLYPDDFVFPVIELPPGVELPDGVDLPDISGFREPQAPLGPEFTTAFVLMQGSANLDQLSDAYFDAADGWRRDIEEVAPAESEWIVSTRQDGLVFDSYYQDTLRLQRIGYVFPLVFFAVAALVSLTTMSRMIEEQRTQIGIYKALGYHRAAIVIKFVLYAFLASVLGAIVGTLIGSYLFPSIIADAYGHLYDFPPVNSSIPWDIATIAGAAAVGSVVFVTLFTGLRALAGAPALLMRPRPPAKGRRVLLERATVLWRRMGFFSKVTARNIFRYKRRFFMTLIGVAGCTALLLTAFGLRDSIGAIAGLQFSDITNYQYRAFTADPATDADVQRVTEVSDQFLLVDQEAVTITGPDDEASANLLVPEDPATLNSFLRLLDSDTGEIVPFADDQMFITDKLADTIGVRTGDPIEIALHGGATANTLVSNIVDNYVGHFVYLSPQTYQELFGAAPEFTNVFIQSEQPDVAAELLVSPNVIAVVSTADMLTSLSDSTDAMGVVTWVLVLLACALALVVLFNLININILERMRELATLKVLGFSRGELAMYVYRENFLVIALGVLLGLLGGVFLHRFVLSTVEIDMLRFPHIIHLGSYLLAIALSALFAMFVNLVMYRKLKNINMVESLKAVE